MMAFAYMIDMVFLLAVLPSKLEPVMVMLLTLLLPRTSMVEVLSA